MGLYLQQKKNPDVYDVYVKKTIKYAEAPGLEFPGGTLVGQLFVNVNETLPDAPFYEVFAMLETEIAEAEQDRVELEKLVKDIFKNTKDDVYLIIRKIDNVARGDYFFEL